MSDANGQSYVFFGSLVSSSSLLSIKLKEDLIEFLADRSLGKLRVTRTKESSLPLYL